MAGYASPRSIVDLISHWGLRDTNTTRANGLEDVLENIRLMAGGNIIKSINDCGTIGDWTESDDGTLDVAADGSNYKTGSSSIQITNTAATDASQYIETKLINGSSAPGPLSPDHNDDGTIDLSDCDYIGGWVFGIATGGFGTAGELQFGLVNNGTASSLVNMPAAADDVHQRFELDISSLDRDKVSAIRFYGNNTNAAEAITIDSICAYKYGNGRGPVMGSCIQVPIASGQTLTRGQIVQVNVASIFGAIDVQVEGAAAVNSYGIVVVGGTGVAGGTVYATVQYTGLAYMRAGSTHGIGAGEYAGWDSATTIAGEGGANPEYAICKALEAPGADSDDILVALTCYGTIS